MRNRKVMRNLGVGDVLGILVCWAGAAAVAYFVEYVVVIIICVAGRILPFKMNHYEASRRAKKLKSFKLSAVR